MWGPWQLSNTPGLLFQRFVTLWREARNADAQEQQLVIASIAYLLGRAGGNRDGVPATDESLRLSANTNLAGA